MQVDMSVGKVFFNINDTIAQKAERDPEPDHRLNQPCGCRLTDAVRNCDVCHAKGTYINSLGFVALGRPVLRDICASLHGKPLLPTTSA
jgi:hypothetical protein